MSYARNGSSLASSDWEAIGDMIRRRRKDLDLDRGDAARRACLSKHIWKRLEDRYGAYLNDEVLLRAADTLRMDTSAFMKRCGRPVGRSGSHDLAPRPVVDTARWSAVGDAVHRRRKDLEAADRTRIFGLTE